MAASAFERLLTGCPACAGMARLDCLFRRTLGLLHVPFDYDAKRRSPENECPGPLTRTLIEHRADARCSKSAQSDGVSIGQPRQSA